MKDMEKNLNNRSPIDFWLDEMMKTNKLGAFNKKYRLSFGSIRCTLLGELSSFEKNIC